MILTSDHGESFERGYWEHLGPFVYDPGIHIPLLISAPGQTTRRDFHSVTNSVDLIPTILNISSLEIPDWCEGEILPGMGGVTSNERPTFSMDAKKASAFGDLSPITIAMHQGDYKIIYYKGYEEKDSPYNKGLFELYNLRDDPEELHNLINTEQAIAQQMQEQLLEAYHTANQPLQ
jgi:arylsulfatase A-like enzyme